MQDDDPKDASRDPEGRTGPPSSDSAGSPLRRYGDAEIKAIFAAATDTQDIESRAEPSETGLTLSELKEIGRQVGMDTDLIERAAARLDHAPRPAPRRRYFGLPVGVARTAELPGALNDRAWDRLVAALRETFEARGTVRQEGATRQWWNGNLHALVEPTATGQRLRLGTDSSRLRAMLGLGAGGLAVGVGIFTLSVLQGAPDMLPAVAATLGVGVWALVSSTVRSFRWARTREEQMDAIARYAVDLAGAEAAVLPPGKEEPDDG